tara:strand:- start:630 stop:935 length:306 start_codon:yes stop_codon:yes gene_type:complete
MENYLEKYSKSAVSKFQAGGEMPAPQGAPAPEAAPQGGQPDVEGMLQQYAQAPDPALAVQIVETILSMMGGAQGGAPMPAAKNGMRMTERKAPSFKKGGKL